MADIRSGLTKFSPSRMIAILQTWSCRHSRDLIAIATLAAIGFSFVYVVSRAIDARFFQRSAMDVWFEADIPRVFANMTSRWSHHYRTSVHPLFPILTYPPVFLLEKGVGLSSMQAVRIVLVSSFFLMRQNERI